MTIKTTPSGGASTLVFGVATASADFHNTMASGPTPMRVIDLRRDEWPATGQQDEFAIDAYLAEQDQTTQARVAEAGGWVADQLYPGSPTLAALRLRSGLSQAELARRCGLEQPHVSRYETGRHEPGVFQAEKMATALGVSLDVLVQALKRSARPSHP